MYHRLVVVSTQHYVVKFLNSSLDPLQKTTFDTCQAALGTKPRVKVCASACSRFLSSKDAVSVGVEASRKTAYQYSRGGRGCTTHCSPSMEHLTAALQVSIWRADPFCKQSGHCVLLKGTNLATRRSSIRFPRFLLMATCK